MSLPLWVGGLESIIFEFVSITRTIPIFRISTPQSYFVCQFTSRGA